MSSHPTFALKHRRTILIALILATASVTVAVLLVRKTEPRYGGYPLSTWVKVLSSNNFQDFGPDCTQEKAPDAILDMGTNAIPFLVEWLKYEGGSTPVRDVVNWGMEKFPVLEKIPGLEDWAETDTKVVRTYGSRVALRILGSNAAPAIPELVEMATKKGTALGVQLDGVRALASIGKSATPALLNVVTNRGADNFIRCTATDYIRSFRTDAAQTIPALLQILRGDDPFAAAAAAEILGSIGLEPRRVVPALTDAALRRTCEQSAIDALGKFGPNAVDALPTLRKIAAGKNEFSHYIRLHATNAIAQIRANSTSSVVPSP